MRRQITKQPKGAVASASAITARPARSRKSSIIGMRPVIMIASVVAVIVFVLVQSQRTLCTMPEKRAVLGGVPNNRRRAFATDVTVQAKHAVGSAHHHMQVVADQQNRAAMVVADFFNQRIKIG